jgi:uncharacterized protein DUF4258
VTDPSDGAAEALPEYVFTPHAMAEMGRRGVSQEVVARVLRGPEQRFEVRPGRAVFQSRLVLEEPSGTFLVRVFVDVDRRPAEVVTAYRTSKIDKYWREAP